MCGDKPIQGQDTHCQIKPTAPYMTAIGVILLFYLNTFHINFSLIMIEIISRINLRKTHRIRPLHDRNSIVTMR